MPVVILFVMKYYISDFEKINLSLRMVKGSHMQYFTGKAFVPLKPENFSLKRTVER